MNERTRRPLHSLSVLARPPPRFRLPRPLQSRSPRTLEVSGSFNRALAPPKQPSSDSETEIEVYLPPLPASASAPSARAGCRGSCWFKGSRPRCRAHIMWRGARCGRAHGNPQIQPNARAPHAFTHIYACCARPFAFCSFVAQIRHEPAYDQEVQGAATAAEEDGRRKRALPRVAGRLGHLPGPLAVGSGAGHGVAQHLRDHRGRLRGREAGAFFPHRESFSQTHGLLAARVGPCLTLVCALPPPVSCAQDTAVATASVPPGDLLSPVREEAVQAAAWARFRAAAFPEVWAAACLPDRGNAVRTPPPQLFWRGLGSGHSAARTRRTRQRSKV
jgi:hypothetical protein